MNNARGVGSAIGHYIIESIVGAGGMGVVYAARDAKLGRKVAVKVLRRHGAGIDDHLRTRLVREARAMAKLSHPNVVTVFEAGTEGDEIYLVMEFVEGHTLGEWLQGGRSWRDVVRTMIAAGRGLEAAHNVGLIHRDFKPDNVLIDGAGRARVTDFGIARSSGDQDESSLPAFKERTRELSLTGTGDLIGTPRYMSPEQCSGTKVDARADQFSFCLVLYEAVYGEHPFGCDSAAETIARIAEGDRVPFKSRKSVPRWLKLLIDCGLSIDPADRYPDMGALLQELERRRTDWIKLSATPVAAVAVVFGVQQFMQSTEGDATARTCETARTEIAQLWTDVRRQELAAAFQATKLPYAEESWQSAARVLDGYVLKLREASDEACRKRDELADERASCIAERRRDFAAQLSLFAKADAQIVEHAVRAAQTLPDVRECTSAEALSRTVSLPTDAAALAKIKEADELTVLAELHLSSGKFDDSLRLARDAVTRARDSGYASSLANALVIAGRAQWQKGLMTEARDTFQEATTVAERARDDLAKARALTWLVSVAGVELNDYRAGEVFADLAHASLERAGASKSTVAGLLEYHMGMMDIKRGRPSDALVHEMNALRLREDALGKLHGDVGATLILVGICARELGRFDDALEYQRKAMDILEKAFGSGHPFISNALIEVGNVYVAQGNIEQAVATYQDAIGRLERSVGGQHPDLAVALSNLGAALLSIEHPPEAAVREAIAHFERAKVIEEAVLGTNARAVGETLQNLGRAQLAIADATSALASFKAALEIFNQHPELTKITGALFFDLAQAAHQANDKAAAKSYARSAIERFEAADLSNEAQMARDWEAQLR